VRWRPWARYRDARRQRTAGPESRSKFGLEMREINGSAPLGQFACTVGPCPLSMRIVSDGLGPFARSSVSSLRGENNLIYFCLSNREHSHF
jgi:hypothetical protein